MAKANKSAYKENQERIFADIDEVSKDSYRVRAALEQLVGECCDKDGAILRPSEEAVKQAILALNPPKLRFIPPKG